MPTHLHRPITQHGHPQARAPWGTATAHTCTHTRANGAHTQANGVHAHTHVRLVHTHKCDWCTRMCAHTREWCMCTHMHTPVLRASRKTLALEQSPRAGAVSAPPRSPWTEPGWENRLGKGRAGLGCQGPSVQSHPTAPCTLGGTFSEPRGAGEGHSCGWISEASAPAVRRFGG